MLQGCGFLIKKRSLPDEIPPHDPGDICAVTSQDISLAPHSAFIENAGQNHEAREPLLTVKKRHVVSMLGTVAVAERHDADSPQIVFILFAVSLFVRRISKLVNIVKNLLNVV